jgi:hypothetical protein
VRSNLIRNDYHTESAGNETLIYIEPEYPKPKPTVSIKLIPTNPIYSASQSLKDALTTGIPNTNSGKNSALVEPAASFSWRGWKISFKRVI